MLGTLAQTIRFPITPTASLVVADLYFPLASAPAAFWAAVRSDGGDIRVYRQDGVTPCAREIVGFDPVAKTGSVWFAANGGTAFYICAGSGAPEPAADATIGKYNVWDANMKGIYHCSDAASPLTDSTSGANSASQEGSLTYGVTGKMGLGVQGAGSGDAKTDAQILTGDAYSMACWVYTSAASGIVHYCIARGTGSKYDTLGMYQNRWLIYNGTDLLQGSTVAKNQWNRLLFVRNGTSVKLYLNGAIDIDGTAGIKYDTGYAMLMAPPFSMAFGWQGRGDEYRFYNRALSADEAAQYYANQNNPATFWTVGAAQ